LIDKNLKIERIELRIKERERSTRRERKEKRTTITKKR